MTAFPSLLLAIAFLLGGAPLARAVTFGQADTFSDGTTQGWSHGGPSSNPPANISTGGPAGAGDRYLQNVALGGGGPGSRMIMFNSAQWSGNFTAAGVDRITLQVANFGSTPLYLRVTLTGGSSSSVYSSSQPFALPADGIWRPATFDLNDTALTQVSGVATLEEVLAQVTELRLLSAADGPAFIGDAVAGTLGVDNLLARDLANFRLRITGITRSAGVPQISFTTIAGRQHRVERASSLAPDDWRTLSNAGAIEGTGGTLQVSDMDAGAIGLRFYRVVLLPPPPPPPPAAVRPISR